MTKSSVAATTDSRAESLPPAEQSQRLVSVDALRGFDMFWIVGGESIVHALRKINKTGFTKTLADQLTHKDWAGFAFLDLIFPMFVFIAGVSIVFSITKSLVTVGRLATIRRIILRSVILFLLGIIYSGGISGGWEHVRVLGVLQRIALCYLFAGLLFCMFNARGLVVCCVTLLVGYWAAMSFVPVPEIGRGSFAKGANLANYLDSKYLPGRKYDGTWDPEGLFSTLPAIVTCLLGVLAGILLRNGKISNQRKALWLIGAGLCSVALGFLWGLQFPVIKKIWTSSYVLVAGGYSAILLGVFYQVIDIWKLQLWARPFVWMGMNAITIYMAHNLINFGSLSERFVGGPIEKMAGRYGDLVVAGGAAALSFLLVWFLYRKKIFLRA